MKNKIYLIMLLGLFLIGNVLAANCGDNNIGVFKKGEVINLRQTCDTCSYVNLSSVTIPPNSNLLYFNNQMTKQGIEFTTTFYNSTTVGDYFYVVRGDKDGVDQSETFCFEVSQTGFVGTLGFYIIFLILSLGIIILGYSFEDAWVVMLGAFGLILFGLFVYLYGINGIKDTYYTYGIAIITIMGGAYFGVRAGLEKMDLGD
jgi:hypothetical protein